MATLTLTINDLQTIWPYDLDGRLLVMYDYRCQMPRDDEPLPIGEWWQQMELGIESVMDTLRVAQPQAEAAVLAVRAAAAAARSVEHLLHDKNQAAGAAFLTAIEAWLAAPAELREQYAKNIRDLYGTLGDSPSLLWQRRARYAIFGATFAIAGFRYNCGFQVTPEFTIQHAINAVTCALEAEATYAARHPDYQCRTVVALREVLREA